jgi:hypothetical protein
MRLSPNRIDKPAALPYYISILAITNSGGSKMHFENRGGGCCHGHHHGQERGPHGHHPHGWEGDHHEGGCCHGHGQRHFYSREEIIARLEEYLKQLQAEARGVEEHIARMKKGEE